MALTDFDIVSEAHNQHVDCTFLTDCPVCAALARIEAENEEWRKRADERGNVYRRLLAAEAENAQLREALEKHRGWLDEALAEVASYQAENARLREALADPIGYANDAYEREIARLHRIEEAARDTERELHDWLDGRPQHIHELVAHLLVALRSALEGREET